MRLGATRTRRREGTRARTRRRRVVGTSGRVPTEGTKDVDEDDEDEDDD
jgi:hypothetical protein